MKTEKKILQGNALDVLKTLPSESVHCVITSPPYYNLRDYGTANWQGGNADCDHKGEPFRTRSKVNKNTGTGDDVKNSELHEFYKDICGKCGATRIDSQIGLENSPEEFIANLVSVFSEVYRVLRSDGTLWVNIGDSYTGSGFGAANYLESAGNKQPTNHGSTTLKGRSGFIPQGFKRKELIGIPWRLAFALQSSGWYLRQDIIWAKPNPMPESVKDRFTRSHEYIFLLSKKPRYFFDARAVAEDCVTLDDVKRRVENGKGEWKGHKKPSQYAMRSKNKDGSNRSRAELYSADSKRNKRSVFTVAIKPFKDAHFATFPEELIEPMVLAATSEKGCCASCGAPYERVLEKQLPSKNTDRPQVKRAYELADKAGLTKEHFDAIRAIGIQDAGQAKVLYTGAGKNTEEIQRLANEAKEVLGGYFREFLTGTLESIGWRKTCSCETNETFPATVLDPFGGAATTGLVALKHKRNFIGIELSGDYIQIAEKRTAEVQVNLF